METLVQRNEQTPMISTGLDYYKPTMSQVQFLKHPNADVSFTLKNRGKNRLADHVDVDELTTRLGEFALGWQDVEVEYLATHERRDGQPLFDACFLDYLRENQLPPVDVRVDDETDDISVETTGKWPLVTFWETVVMSEINELYFEDYIARNGIDKEELFVEGDRRLTEKIELLKSRPDIKFAEFGTRRRFSREWQRHVVERLKNECPDNLIGTSNVALAQEFDLMPIGTYAHEMPMVYGALAQNEDYSPLAGHAWMMRDWEEVYGDNLSTALTDTYTDNFFFAEFTEEQAKHWAGLRHDSGDPIAFGERVIDFYHSQGIDPTEKTIVFSDGLDMETILEIADHFKDQVNIIFGWGTTLTNDLGLTPNNIVMKATEADGTGTVKLSNEPGKHTGAPEDVARYQLDVEYRKQAPKKKERVAV